MHNETSSVKYNNTSSSSTAIQNIKADTELTPF